MCNHPAESLTVTDQADEVCTLCGAVTQKVYTPSDWQLMDAEFQVALKRLWCLGRKCPKGHPDHDTDYVPQYLDDQLLGDGYIDLEVRALGYGLTESWRYCNQHTFKSAFARKKYTPLFPWSSRPDPSTCSSILKFEDPSSPSFPESPMLP